MSDANRDWKGERKRRLRSEAKSAVRQVRKAMRRTSPWRRVERRLRTWKEEY